MAPSLWNIHLHEDKIDPHLAILLKDPQDVVLPVGLGIPGDMKLFINLVDLIVGARG